MNIFAVASFVLIQLSKTLQNVWNSSFTKLITNTLIRSIGRLMDEQQQQPQPRILGVVVPDEPMEEDDSDLEEDEDNVYEAILSASDLECSNSDSSDSTADDEDPKWTRRLTRYYIKHNAKLVVKNNPIYSFQPFKLVKQKYKLRNALSDFPQARSGHRVIATDTCLYSLGGYNPRSALFAARRGRCLLFQELWSYNFATNTWKLMLDADTANMPNELASNALAIHNNILISHGGTGYPFGESCSNDCYLFTTNTKPLVERLKVSGDLPVAQYGPGIVIHNNYLYTIGGTTGFDYSCDVYRLNLTTSIWEIVYICRPEMRDDPEGRYRHEVVYDGQHIYVLGGGTSHSVYDLKRIPAFNLLTNRWDYVETLPDRSVATTTAEASTAGYPKPRKCFSCVQHKTLNGDIEAFITGGLQGDFINYFADIWKLNLRTKQWCLIRSAVLPKPLYFHSAAHAGNGCMYIFGGIEYNQKDMRRRNDLYKMWMTIPKLSEMCWDAITFYNENLYNFNQKQLLASGIPQRFAQRVPVVGNRKQLRDWSSTSPPDLPSPKRLNTQSED